MNGKNIGYIRVSSIDQNTARQLEGVPLDKTFIDTCSGKDTRRPGLMACLDYVREGEIPCTSTASTGWPATCKTCCISSRASSNGPWPWSFIRKA